MNVYPAGTTVIVTVPFVNYNGDPVTPTALSVRVLDETDSLLATLSVDLEPESTEVDVEIPAAYNNLAAGVTDGARAVELVMTTSEGSIPTTLHYALRTVVRLIVPSNSFQTFTQANLTAAKMANLTGWSSATDYQRQNALLMAYRRITRLSFKISYDPGDLFTYAGMGEEVTVSRAVWLTMTEAEFGEYPADFREALCMAQIAEANEQLGGDLIGRKRRDGILSESIGESSMMFRTGKPLDFGICSEAMKFLQGYHNFTIRIGRA